MTKTKQLLDFELSIDLSCQYFNCSRQAYYQGMNRIAEENLTKEIVLELVREKRKLLPKCGTRKLLHLLKEDLKGLKIKFGRDALFQLLGEEGLLVERKKQYCSTTNSRHAFRIYENLILNLSIDNILQAVVADITYIRTMDGFLYLALLTDMFSRKIVGWDVSDSLELEGCVRAAQLLFKGIPAVCFEQQKTIHHSDRGSQYCSYDYVNLLKNKQLQISMAATGNCYENAMAERVNGILKQEFGLGETFVSKAVVAPSVAQAIHLYNEVRPHLSLDYATPNAIFKQHFATTFSLLKCKL